MHPFPAYRMLLQGDARIWSFATLYGLAAGVITYAASFSEGWHLDALAFAMNYPAIPVMILIFSSGISMPPFIYPIDIIGVSAVVWSFIGFVVYAFVKMFRLGP